MHRAPTTTAGYRLADLATTVAAESARHAYAATYGTANVPTITGERAATQCRYAVLPILADVEDDTTPDTLAGELATITGTIIAVGLAPAGRYTDAARLQAERGNVPAARILYSIARAIIAGQNAH